MSDRLQHAIKWAQDNPLTIHALTVPHERMKRRNHHTKYIRERAQKDPEFKLLSRLRCRVRAALQGKGKSKKTRDILGCSLAEFRAHLERQFQPGMSWENYGQWHVDHIRPCASFDLLDPEQVVACFHYTNTQPLWASQNYRKKDHWKPIA